MITVVSGTIGYVLTGYWGNFSFSNAASRSNSGPPSTR